MKKHYKKLLAFILAFVFILNSVPVYAYTQNWSDAFLVNTVTLMRYCDLLYGFVFDHNNNYTEDFLDKFYDIGYDRGFFNDRQSFEDWWRANVKVKKSDGSDSDDFNGVNLNVSTDFKDAIGELCQFYKDYADSTQVWRYYTTYTPTDFDSTQFPNGNSYTYFRSRLINECSKDIYTIFLNAVPGYGGLVYHINSLSDNGFVVTGMPMYAACFKHDWSGFQEDTPIKVSYFDFYQNMYITGDSLGDLLDDLASRGLYKNDCLVFHDSNGNEILSGHRGLSDFVNFQPQGVWTFDMGTSFTNRHLYYIVSSTHQKFMVFESVEQLIKWQTDQLRPGYFTHDPTVSGNTITGDQWNNGVNYGDIIAGDQWNIIIGPGNRVEPIVDPGSGGGGGGTIPNPDPGGGGGGGTDPGSGGWDFSGLLRGLMTLIQSIFNLISSLVGYIAELLGELITTITGLIDRLKLLVTGGVMELFNAFFPWLPPEVASLISLSFLLGVIIAIIKFIRG